MPRLAKHCAVALMLLSPFSLAAADRQAASCYSLELKNPPEWITSGATWDRDNERLLMVDPDHNQIVSYNLLGERDTIPNPSPGLPPSKIARSNDGFLLESTDGSMLRLDRRLAVGSRNLADKLSPNGNAFSLYQWAATESGDVVAFAAVLTPHGPDPVQYGFFRTQGNSKLQPLLPADKNDKNQNEFFLLGYPYIASSDDEAFFLSMAKHPSLYRVIDGNAEKLKNALPRKYATRPDFKTPMTGKSNAPARYEELETFSIPAGLYAQDGYLYLLTREPAGGGKTIWWFYQIDPTGAGSVRGRVRLPTNANHLTVIPTPDQGWMFIERSKVEPSQKQKIGPMVVISNEAIHSLSIPTSCPKGGGILWANEKHNKALFVPETLLASGMMVPVELLSQKNFYLRRSGEPQNAPPCDSLESPRGQGSVPNATDLKTLLNSSRVVVVGRIISTEPGWDARLRRVATKVHFKVERSVKGNLKVGRKINFLSPGGSMLLADKPVCTSPRRDFYQPRVGDKIVVSAELSAADSRLLDSPYVFPLSEGKVQPEPYPALLPEQKPISLSKLLSSSSNDAL